ncbi:MAG: hypothetical protein ACXVH1_40025 [Solirubrobacteraceae bacterium]
MATATKKARAATGATRGMVVASDSVSMEFLVVEDNGGAFHWTLMDRDGSSLARSPSFTSYEDTEDAARVVLANAGSARLDRRAATVSSLDMRNKTNVDGAEGASKKRLERQDVPREEPSERRDSPRNS